MDAISGLGSIPQSTYGTDATANSGSGDDAQQPDGAQSVAGPDSAKNLTLLKKSHDLAKDNAAQLLASLPPPRSPSPPGVGGKIDLSA